MDTFLTQHIADLTVLRNCADPESQHYEALLEQEILLRRVLCATDEHGAAQREWVGWAREQVRNKRTRGKAVTKPRALGTPQPGGAPCA